MGWVVPWHTQTWQLEGCNVGQFPIPRVGDAHQQNMPLHSHPAPLKVRGSAPTSHSLKPGLVTCTQEGEGQAPPTDGTWNRAACSTCAAPGRAGRRHAMHAAHILALSLLSSYRVTGAGAGGKQHRKLVAHHAFRSPDQFPSPPSLTKQTLNPRAPGNKINDATNSRKDALLSCSICGLGTCKMADYMSVILIFF